MTLRRVATVCSLLLLFTFLSTGQATAQSPLEFEVTPDLEFIELLGPKTDLDVCCPGGDYGLHPKLLTEFGYAYDTEADDTEASAAHSMELLLGAGLGFRWSPDIFAAVEGEVMLSGEQLEDVSLDVPAVLKLGWTGDHIGFAVEGRARVGLRSDAPSATSSFEVGPFAHGFADIEAIIWPKVNFFQFNEGGAGPEQAYMNAVLPATYIYRSRHDIEGGSVREAVTEGYRIGLGIEGASPTFLNGIGYLFNLEMTATFFDLLPMDPGPRERHKGITKMDLMVLQFDELVFFSAEDWTVSVVFGLGYTWFPSELPLITDPEFFAIDAGVSLKYKECGVGAFYSRDGIYSQQFNDFYAAWRFEATAECHRDDSIFGSRLAFAANGFEAEQGVAVTRYAFDTELYLTFFDGIELGTSYRFQQASADAADDTLPPTSFDVLQGHQLGVFVRFDDVF